MNDSFERSQGGQRGGGPPSLHTTDGQPCGLSSPLISSLRVLSVNNVGVVEDFPSASSFPSERPPDSLASSTFSPHLLVPVAHLTPMARRGGGGGNSTAEVEELPSAFDLSSCSGQPDLCGLRRYQPLLARKRSVLASSATSIISVPDGKTDLSSPAIHGSSWLRGDKEEAVSEASQDSMLPEVHRSSGDKSLLTSFTPMRKMEAWVLEVK